VSVSFQKAWHPDGDVTVLQRYCTTDPSRSESRAVGFMLQDRLKTVTTLRAVRKHQINPGVGRNCVGYIKLDKSIRYYVTGPSCATVNPIAVSERLSRAEVSEGLSRDSAVHFFRALG
jgi:hypothetical protein